MMLSRSTLPNSLFADEESQFTSSTIKLEDKFVTLELENVKLKKEMKDFNDKLMREVEEVKKNSITKTNFMDELIRNLEATTKQQSPSSVKISVLQKFLYGHKKNKSNEEELDRDCYVLMMFSPIFSVSWLLGLFTFVIQVTLGSLLIHDQVNSDFFGTKLSVPIKGKGTMRLAQFLTIILAIASQTDVLNGFRTIFLLRYDKEQWPKVLKKENDPSLNVWLKHVFFPNMLKILEGVIILAATFLVILQSGRVVDLLKDYTGLFVISAVDDLFFEIAGIGYFGSKLRKKTNELKQVRIGENNNKFSVYHYLLPTLTTLCMLGGWIYVIVGQNRGTYVKQMYPLCPVNDTLSNGKLYLSIIGDGQCQSQKGMGTNTLNCGWDGNDCLILNDRYPDCEIKDPSLLGNGECNTGKYNTLLCGFDNGDCVEDNKAIEADHPNCNVEIWTFVGDGFCNGGEYYSEECGWDGNDCMNCTVGNMTLVGDGYCNGGAYNSEDCDFDGGDCSDFNDVYPNCPVKDPYLVGDGFCNGGEYFSEECGWDGNDCMNCNVGNMSLIGDGICDGGAYNSEECSFDGGDCSEFNEVYPNCAVEKEYQIGNGVCNGGGDYNRVECGWDGGDCEQFNSFAEFFSSEEVTDREIFLDESSPQFKALKWIADEDRASIEDRKVIQRYVLAVFYYSLGGDKWNVCAKGSNCVCTNANFGCANTGGYVAQLSPEDECEWYRHQCDEDGWITHINYGVSSGNNLVGKIPDEFRHLDKLEVLNLSSNPLLSGWSPNVFGNMQNLRDITLINTGITGGFPDSLFELSSLVQLRFCCGFGGSLSSRFGQLNSLRVLEGSMNSFTGQIPSELGNLTNLRELQLSFNNLSGDIPSELGKLTNIRELKLDGNNLSGDIPAEILELPSLKFLILRNNNLDGTISTYIPVESNLQELHLQRNNLYGSIPDGIFSTDKLKRLDLSMNHLTGTLPDKFATLDKLTDIYLHTNKFSGTIPESLAIASLEKLLLYRNKFNGTMPESICSLATNGNMKVVKANCTAIECDCCVCVE